MNKINLLEKQIETKTKELEKALCLANERTNELVTFKTENISMETKINELLQECTNKDDLNKKLQNTLSLLNTQIHDYEIAEKNKINAASKETKDLFEAIKKIELDKNRIVEEYKAILKKEREEFANNMEESQMKIIELQTHLSRYVKVSKTVNY